MSVQVLWGWAELFAASWVIVVGYVCAHFARTRTIFFLMWWCALA